MNDLTSFTQELNNAPNEDDYVEIYIYKNEQKAVKSLKQI